MWLEMKVKNLVLDPLSNMPMIVLRDDDDKRSLSIWVALAEANAIALELEKIPTARPMTHDLFKTVLDELLVRYLETVVYQAATDNIASEQSARMVAMKAASDNALSIIDELQLIYNKSRQAAITKELSEIVGGAAAV